MPHTASTARGRRGSQRQSEYLPTHEGDAIARLQLQSGHPLRPEMCGALLGFGRLFFHLFGRFRFPFGHNFMRDAEVLGHMVE